MRVQAPNYAQDFFILGKNSDHQAVGNTRENVGNRADSGLLPDEVDECVGRHHRSGATS
jgi:hypothetical protein